MSEIIEQCRAVIFCGGTMSPLSDLIQQLINKDLQSRSIAKSLSHVVNPQNINLSILATGPSGICMNFSYESRNNVQMINELGVIVLNYARVIPAGLIVFFPSFSYMNRILEIWKSKNIFCLLESAKKVTLSIIHKVQVFIKSTGIL